MLNFLLRGILHISKSLMILLNIILVAKVPVFSQAFLKIKSTEIVYFLMLHIHLIVVTMTLHGNKSCKYHIHHFMH
jgi:hypothetical protein